MENQEYNAIVSYVLSTLLDIVRAKCKAKRINSELMYADVLVLLDSATTQGTLSYPDYYSIHSVYQMANRHSKQLNKKEKPTIRLHESTLARKQDTISEKEAKESVRILIDFLKGDAEKTKDLRYEPFISQVIASESFRN